MEDPRLLEVEVTESSCEPRFAARRSSRSHLRGDEREQKQALAALDTPPGFCAGNWPRD